MTDTLLLTLIAASGSQALDETTVAACCTLGNAGPPRWLAPQEAVEITFAPGLAAQALKARARAIVAQRPVDVVVQRRGAQASPPKRLLIADMESTIIEQEMLDELAGHIGQRAHVAAITERAMRGELDFEAAIKERVALLKSLDADVLRNVYDQTVTLMPGATTLLATMKARGAYCALVSGGFTVFTQRVAERLRFDTHRANTLKIEGGRLAGTVIEPILGRQAKLQALEEFARTQALNLADTLAVGDGANDLAMLHAAGLGVAFRAKPKVAADMDAAPGGAVITHGDLTALLYLQGINKDQFQP